MVWYEYLVMIVYISALLLLFLYSLGQLQLTISYLKHKQKDRDKTPIMESWPNVTIQLPVYNEKYVVERLIDAVCHIDYPVDKLEIQVLDDSTDITSALIDDQIQKFQAKNVNIKHVRRDNRDAFKAGALAYGLERATGEFIAIFDADFLPKPNFLKNTIPYFNGPNIGMVQTRWGHLNRDYSFFTKMQAFGLDAHFSVEQTGRNIQRSFINFNGTAGVWRKSCIVEAGGWSAQTLTEDLDLSYRAQLKGWEFKYLEHVETPAELPILMPAIKTQQYRWNKGAAETSMKNLRTVFKSNFPLLTKVHATFHLLNSSVFVILFIAAVLSLPMLIIKSAHEQLDALFLIGNFMLLGFFSIGFYFWVASKNAPFTKIRENFLKTYLSFMTISMGMSLHNGIAVLEGFLGRKTPFVRTPKFNSSNDSGIVDNNSYMKYSLDPISILESILGLYFIAAIALGVYLRDFGLVLFHGMMALGFLVVSYQSLRLKWHAK